jgi:hypothetical protein
MREVAGSVTDESGNILSLATPSPGGQSKVRGTLHYLQIPSKREREREREDQERRRRRGEFVNCPTSCMADSAVVFISESSIGSSSKVDQRSSHRDMNWVEVNPMAGRRVR